MPPPLTVLFMPESAYGPTNDCIGIGDRLLQRGHLVVFAAEASRRAGWRHRAPGGMPLGLDSFRAEYYRTHRPMWTEFDAWVREQGAPALPDLGCSTHPRISI